MLPTPKSQTASLEPVTGVTQAEPKRIDVRKGGTYIEMRRPTVRDIHEVLRKKQAEQAQLGKQIEALQNAAEQLRTVAHLLDDEGDDKAAAAGRG